MNATDIAWVAGVFEGDGSVFMAGNGYTPQVTIAMTDKDVVERVCTIVGRGKIDGPYISNKTLGKTPMWRWRTSGWMSVQAFIAMIWSWLGDRRRSRAKEILLDTRIHRPRGGYHPAELSHVRRWFGKSVRNLTQSEQTEYWKRLRRERTSAS